MARSAGDIVPVTKGRVICIESPFAGHAAAVRTGAVVGPACRSLAVFVLVHHGLTHKAIFVVVKQLDGDAALKLELSTASEVVVWVYRWQPSCRAGLRLRIGRSPSSTLVICRCEQGPLHGCSV